MTILLYLADYFLSPQMRNNASDLMRGYIFVGLTMFNVLISVLVMLILLFYLDLEHNTSIAMGLNLACFVCNTIALILFKRTQNLWLCSNIVLVVLASVMVTGIQISGGYFQSPILQLLLQLPVTAFLLLGLRQGLAWLVLTFLLGAALYVSALTGWGHVQLIERTDAVNAMYFALQLVLLLLVGGALVIYEMLNGLLNKQLNEERNRFEHKASHDDLTGVPNRFEFFRRLRQVIDEARDREHKVGVVYIDLDEFKPINDRHGHHVGDEVLKIITRRIQDALRVSDTTARLGGDEFGLILPGIKVPTDIESILPKVLAAIKQPVEIDDEPVVVYGSCGVAIYPNHSRDYNALCRYADTAMYRAKQESDTYLVYSRDMAQD